MPHYRIENKTSGADLGIYSGETADAAIEAMHLEAGYASAEEVAAVLQTSMEQIRNELLVTELNEITVCLLGDDCERTYVATAQWVADDVWLPLTGECLSDVSCALVAPVGNPQRETLIYLHPIHGWTSLGRGTVRGHVSGDRPSDARLARAG